MRTTYKPKPIPKKLGGVVDALYQTRQGRLEDMTAIKAMQSHEAALKQHLIDSLPEHAAAGIAGKFARATLTSKNVPTVTDWDKLYAYIKKNNAWELLQRRVNDQAVYEHWDSGRKIPGLDAFPVVNVSVTKL